MRLANILCLFGIAALPTAAIGRGSGTHHGAGGITRVPPGTVSCLAPPRGAVVVSKRPQKGQYGTIQAAVDALSTTDSRAQVLFIGAGTYEEAVHIPARAAQLTIYGETPNSKTHLSNRVTITHSAAQSQGLDNDRTATLRVFAQRVSIFNINVVNGHGPGSQAVALSAQADRQAYYACKFIGYQNTVLAETGNQVYSGCYFEGSVDVIFGEYAQVFVHRSDFGLRPVPHGVGGWVLAPGGLVGRKPARFVVDKARIGPAAGYALKPLSIHLGRPWGTKAVATVQLSQLSNIIHTNGWDVWLPNEPRTQNADFGEYGNFGPGARGPRASFSHKASKELSLGDVIGDTSWVDLSFLSVKAAPSTTCSRAPPRM